MAKLTLPTTVVRDLRSELLKDDEQERFAFLYAGGSGRLLGHRVVTVPDDAMARQSQTACRPDPSVERDHVGKCYDEQLAPVIVHSHPFSATPRFSSIDVESMDRFREWITGLFPNESFGFAVVGTQGIDVVGSLEKTQRSSGATAEQTSGAGGTPLEALPIEVIGEWKLTTPVPDSTSRFAVPEQQQEFNEPTVQDRSDAYDDGGTETVASNEEIAAQGRFDRGIRALGVDGQRRLASVTVGIVGVGGLGSLVAEQLARLGVESFVLVDDDSIEENNLPRLAGAYDHHVGKPKVDVVREHLWRCGSDVDVQPHQLRIQEQPAALDHCDVVVGCIDEVTTRSFCNEYAVKHLAYYLDAGVRIDLTDDQAVERTGYVHLVAPGSNACFDCLGRHDQAAARLEQLSPAERAVERERGYIDASQLTPEPALVHLNGLCASKTVSVFVDFVTDGSAPPDFIRYEDHDNEMVSITTEPSDACPTCGEDGVLGVGSRSFGDEQFVPKSDQAISD